MKLDVHIITLFLFISCFGSNVLCDEPNPEIVVVGYNSYDSPINTLIFGSIDENEDLPAEMTDRNFQSVGLGSHLWIVDEDGPELKRGWMFRMRLTMQQVKDEYKRRGQEDFIVVVADAMDVYVKESLNRNTLEQLKDRFLTEFSDHKIVFSAQIYCCNPWEIREIGRRDWDEYHNKTGEIPSMFKHLNAGTFMGYASAIIEMTEEMNLWSTTYHPQEAFHSLAGLEATKGLHMIDLEVDDDEWQLAAWFFKDQQKEIPFATLDYNQNLFTVTGAFRVQETGDDGYVVFSRDQFYEMFGPFPTSFNKDTDMDQLVLCPYEYDAAGMEFTNTISGGQPLLFHFAGNDWLCACTVFAQQGFQNIPKKFRDNCDQRYSLWYDRVQEGILDVAYSNDKDIELHLKANDNAVQDARRLDNFEHREIKQKNRKQMMKSKPKPYKNNHRELRRKKFLMKNKTKPYKSSIFRPRELRRKKFLMKGKPKPYKSGIFKARELRRKKFLMQGKPKPYKSSIFHPRELERKKFLMKGKPKPYKSSIFKPCELRRKKFLMKSKPKPYK